MRRWAKKDESRSGLPTAWCESQSGLKTCMICWRTWTRRWQRFESIYHRGHRGTRREVQKKSGRSPVLRRNLIPRPELNLSAPRCPLWLTRVPGQPVQVSFVAFGNFQHDALRQVVGMQLLDGGAHVFEALTAGLDDQQPLFSRFDLAFPAINRFDPRNDVDAAGHTALDECPGNPLCFIGRSRGGEHHAHWGHSRLPSKSVSIKSSIPQSAFNPEPDWFWRRKRLKWREQEAAEECRMESADYDRAYDENL